MTDLALLYLEHIVVLRRYLRARVDCADTACELAHEAFVRFIAAGERGAASGDAPLRDARAYLFTIARHLAADHFRVRGDVRFAPLEEAESLPCEQPGPERIAAARQELARLVAAITALPPRGREVFVAVRVDGLTLRAAAARFAITQNAVEKHLARALLALRAALERG